MKPTTRSSAPCRCVNYCLEGRFDDQRHAGSLEAGVLFTRPTALCETMKPLLPAVLLLAVILLTGCGGPDAALPAAALPLTPGPMPACTGVGTPAAIPAGFPAGFPLPLGTVVTVGRDQGNGRVVIGAFIPAALASTSAFLQRELLRGG